jgi:biotin carboxyl carrier protein
MRWHAAWLALLTTPALAAPVTLPARALRYRPQVQGWARVETLSPLVLRTALAARVARVLVVPGEAVQAGQPLVRLAGPKLEGELAAAHARWQSARHELAAAQGTAAAARRTYPVVTDRKALDAAQAALAAAQGDAAATHAAFEALQAQRTLSSPTTATVDAVRVAAGADVAAGASLLTLLPRGSLWLRVEVFGNPPLPATTAARFVPADGGAAIPVRRLAELPTRAPDGARVFNFVATGSARWQAGETGALVWPGSPRAAVAVPAEALVLDAGRWYVLTDVHGKLAAQAVMPGPTRGSEVLITKGLRAGVPVVVRQAYLLFHRDFSAQYAPLD